MNLGWPIAKEQDAHLEEAFAQPRNVGAHTRPRPELYRRPSNKLENTRGVRKLTVKMAHYGFVWDGEKFKVAHEFEIAYVKSGDKGPFVLLLHGVPTNKQEWYPIQELLEGHCQIINIDMLGLGESDHVLDYGLIDRNGNRLTGADGKLVGNEQIKWDWLGDARYIYESVYKELIGEENTFYFIAQDWGGGILFSYASHPEYRKTLKGYCFVDPIALKGYPISEIQDVGRSSMIPFKVTKFQDAEYMANNDYVKAMGAAPQTFVQIFKTMVREEHNKKFNNFGIKSIMDTYVDMDYERPVDRDNPKGATSLTLRPRILALRALAQRSAILSAALLLPRSARRDTRYPEGIRFTQFEGNCLVLWGEQDNMMPATQRYMLRNAMPMASVDVQSVPNAGHFSDVDQPEHVAGAILDWIIRLSKYGTKRNVNVPDIFQGFKRTDVWHGSEREMFWHLREVYGLEQPYDIEHKYKK